MRTAWLAGAVLLLALNAGCVERRYTIYSDPPGAMAFVNGVQLGPTPVDNHYVYYGKYKFTLVKEGYETLEVEQNIPAPWYEWPGLDFFSENVLPFKVRDVRAFHYTMQPMQMPRPDDVVERARNLRSRGKAVVPPPPNPRAVPPAPRTPPGPVAPTGTPPATAPTSTSRRGAAAAAPAPVTGP